MVQMAVQTWRPWLEGRNDQKDCHFEFSDEILEVGHLRNVILDIKDKILEAPDEILNAPQDSGGGPP